MQATIALIIALICFRLFKPSLSQPYLEIATLSISSRII